MSTSSGLGYADFADRIGAEFALQLPDGDRVPLVLTDCAGGPGSFSLIFKAGPRAPIEQAIYQLSTAGLGPESVFLVPVAQRPHDPEFPLEYEAVFNSAPDPGRSAEQNSSSTDSTEEAR